jgi:hypothetical protein
VRVAAWRAAGRPPVGGAPARVLRRRRRGVAPEKPACLPKVAQCSKGAAA